MPRYHELGSAAFMFHECVSTCSFNDVDAVVLRLEVTPQVAFPGDAPEIALRAMSHRSIARACNSRRAESGTKI